MAATQVWVLANNAHGLEPFTESVLPSVIIEDNDVGVPNIRNRSTHQRVFHSFDMVFTETEWETVKAWVRANLKNGIEPFRFPPVNNYTSNQANWVDYRFALEMTDGAWYSDYEHSYNRISVRFTLELL